MADADDNTAERQGSGETEEAKDEVEEAAGEEVTGDEVTEETPDTNEGEGDSGRVEEAPDKSTAGLEESPTEDQGAELETKEQDGVGEDTTDMSTVNWTPNEDAAKEGETTDAPGSGELGEEKSKDEEGLGEENKEEEFPVDVDITTEAEQEAIDRAVEDLTEEQKESLREVFQLYAIEERIDYTNYKKLMRYFGLSATESEFKKWYAAADTNGDMIDFDEFCRLYLANKQPSDMLQEELLKSVETLFGPKDKISLNEVAKIVSYLRREPSDIDPDSLKRFCQSMDTNKDGMVDKMEFVKSLCGGSDF